MNTDIKFKNLSELYTRLLPALRSKVKELKKNGLVYIEELDLWNYLKNIKWQKANDLDLGKMVNDIFDLNIDEFVNYMHYELKNKHLKIDKEERL